MTKFKLRNYQEDAVAKATWFFNNYKKPFLIQVAQGGGKSLIIAEICHKLDEPVLILQPSKELVEQNYAKLKSYGVEDVSIYSASAGEKEIGKYTFATIGSIYKKPELFQHFKKIIVDECLGGETEVLTTDGWVKFKNYQEGTKVAQWDTNGEISFVMPTHYTKRMHTGKAWRVEPRSGKSYIATDGHRHPLKNRATGEWEAITTDRLPKNYNKIMPLAGAGTGNNLELTPIDKLRIATQADAKLCYRKEKYSLYAIQLTKRRKIDRFLSLCHEAGITPSERKSYTINGSTKRAWSYRMPIDTIKSLPNEFDIVMGYTRARQFIQEIAQWDGNVNKRTGQLYYSSTVKENVDFVAAVAVQAGYSCNQTIQVDNRKDTYKNVHRLFISDIVEKSTQTVNKTAIDISEYVYCVTVPSSYFVVRSNGYTFITGNCDLVDPKKMAGMYMKFFRAIQCNSICGLTATPYRIVNAFGLDEGGDKVYTSHVRPLNRIAMGKAGFFWGKIAYQKEMNELIDEGYLSRLDYQVDSDIDWNDLIINSTGADFTAKSIEDYGRNTKRIIKACIAILEAEKREASITFCASIAQAEKIRNALLEKAGLDVPIVTGQTPKKAREDIVQRFRNKEIKHLLNVGVFIAGLDVPHLDTIIFCRPTLSPRVWMQAVGRGTRLDPTKPTKRCLIIDIAGVSTRLGKIESIRMGKEDDGFRDRIESSVGILSNGPLSRFVVKRKLV